jgi:hypothetical protein
MADGAQRVVQEEHLPIRAADTATPSAAGIRELTLSATEYKIATYGGHTGS